MKNVKSRLRPGSTTYVAYVLLLMGFAALGMFVYSLAVASAATWIVGGVLMVLMIASAAGFRTGARNRAEENDSGIEIEGANIWARPLRRAQIGRYLLSYRGRQPTQEPQVAEQEREFLRAA